MLFSQEKHPIIPTKLLTWMDDRPCAYFANSDFSPGPFPPFKLSNTLADIWAFNLKLSSKIESYWRIETHFKFLTDSRFPSIKVEGVWFLFYQENIRTERSKSLNCLKILFMRNLRSLWLFSRPGYQIVVHLSMLLVMKTLEGILMFCTLKIGYKWIFWSCIVLGNPSSVIQVCPAWMCLKSFVYF